MELTQNFLNKWVTDIQNCLGYQVNNKMVQEAYNEYADNCKSEKEPNVLLLNLFDMTTLTRETLTDIICLKYIGVKCPTFSSSASEKKAFRKQMKTVFTPV